MKLVLCTICGDVVRLVEEETRICQCGACGGKYIDPLNAWYTGHNAIPLGIANSSLQEAVFNQPNSGEGETFEAFVIPKDCKTFKKI